MNFILLFVSWFLNVVDGITATTAGGLAILVYDLITQLPTILQSCVNNKYPNI